MLPDFAARSGRLIVEFDGDTGYSPEDRPHDPRPTAIFERDGWRVLRIPDNEVTTNLEGVARTILLALGKDRE